MPARCVFDIETLGMPFDSFDEAQQTYLLHGADTPEKQQEAIEKLSLHNLTSRVIAIAMLNPDTDRGKVLYESPTRESWTDANGTVEFIGTDESGLLQEFWRDIARYDQVITFNGRGFDAPFVMIRSAILSVKASCNLMPPRYNAREHCDLLEQLTFYGATRKFNLDFYCKAFGIKSPKSEGITGLSLRELHEKGEYRAIAKYCLGDVVATAELFRRWNKHLNFQGGAGQP